jgi:hypothetical protein
MAKAAQKSLKISATDFGPDDRVQVIDREATPEENKSRIFYNHMRGLTGTVRRSYLEEEEVWVDVDRDSLPEDVRVRHQETEDNMRKKWLDGLSDEARRKLGEVEKKFHLRYSILVAPEHLILMEKGNPAPTNAASVTASAEDPAPSPARKTLKELNAAEQEFLERAKSQRKPE